MEVFLFKWEHIILNARIAMDQATEEKANKSTQTPSGTKGYSLKSGAVVSYSITAGYRPFFLDSWHCNSNILQRRSSAGRPPRIKKDKSKGKGKGTKLSVYRKCLFPFESIALE